MEDVVIVSAARTAVGKFGGTIAKVSAPDLGATVIKALLERSGVSPDLINEVILGQVLTAGSGQNPARQSVIKSGLPNHVPAFVVGKVCGSGLKATHLAAQAIMCGDADIIIAGGQENMSASPHVLLGSRDGQRMGDWKMTDTMIVDGLWDVYNQYHMGITAENVAKKFEISREAQDAFAASSQNKAEAAQKAGKFKDEIAPVEIVSKKGSTFFDTDEFIKPGVTAESLAALRPAFDKAGTVTAGNASGVNDGACAVLIASEEAIRRFGLTPRARIVAGAAAGVAPRIMGFGPAPASRKALALAGLTIGQMDVIELNEAFAAQALAVTRDLGLADDAANVNPNGGAIALGHPLGASGARLVTTALYQLQRSGGRYGLATMCIGVGQGIALIIERV